MPQFPLHQEVIVTECSGLHWVLEGIGSYLSVWVDHRGLYCVQQLLDSLGYITHSYEEDDSSRYCAEMASCYYDGNNCMLGHPRNTSLVT